MGKLIINAAEMSLDGDGKTEHERNVALNIEENSLEEDEIKEMQKRVADTGLLNTLKIIDSDDLGSHSVKETDFEEENKTDRNNTSSNLISAIQSAKKEIKNEFDLGEVVKATKGDLENGLELSVESAAKIKQRTRAGGRKRVVRNTNRMLLALQEDAAADEMKSEKPLSFLGDNDIKSISGSIRTTKNFAPKSVNFGKEEKQEVSDYDDESSGGETNKSQERARAVTAMGNLEDEVEDASIGGLTSKNDQKD